MHEEAPGYADLAIPSESTENNTKNNPDIDRSTDMVQWFESLKTRPLADLKKLSDTLADPLTTHPDLRGLKNIIDRMIAARTKNN